MHQRFLRVVMYHYVRDPARNEFPRLKALSAAQFQKQLTAVTDRYEMATLESALAFLRGEYEPERDLCLLTFDDGLKEHHSEVLPILIERHIQGLFFVITGCVEGRVAAVHKNHFLMATLDFAEYEAEVLHRLAVLAPGSSADIDPALVRRTYRWDMPEVGRLKYLINFALDADVRDRLLDTMFADHFGDEHAFARALYLSWDEAREMQAHGMLMGGHSHTHIALEAHRDRQDEELARCAQTLHRHLKSQTLWPFSYPYGKPDTFSSATIESLRKLHFNSAFATVVGNNYPGQDPFQIRRIDPKDLA